MKLYAYIDREGSITWNIDETACLDDGSLGFLKKRCPKFDMDFEVEDEE